MKENIVDAVAEAIWRQDRMDEAVGTVSFAACGFPNHYRALAAAAIGALQLTEEIGAATTDNLQQVSPHDDLESAQEACDRFNRVSSFHAVPVARLVSPWSQQGGEK